MSADMAQSHYDSVQGSFVILVKFRKQDLVLVSLLVKESGAEARVRLQHNLKMCKNRIGVCDLGEYAKEFYLVRDSRADVCALRHHISDISLEVAENTGNSKEPLRYDNTCKLCVILGATGVEISSCLHSLILLILREKSIFNLSNCSSPDLMFSSKYSP